jgi:hypothetical protein
MKTSALVLALAVIASVDAFSTSSLPTSRASTTASYAYVPDGFTAESYKKFKDAEKAKQGQNLGKMGPRGFKSRSMQAFQEAMERGETGHLMPVFNAAERVKKGELKVEDIPYMQRGGSWDNSDVKGAKKMKWSSRDKDYEDGGFMKEQSVSIFGYGGGLDWTGKNERKGPSETVPGAAPKWGRNYKAPNVNSMKGVAPPTEPKKKLFGLF